MIKRSYTAALFVTAVAALVACGSTGGSATGTTEAGQLTESKPSTSEVEDASTSTVNDEAFDEQDQDTASMNAEDLALFDDAGPTIGDDTPFYASASLGTGTLTVSDVELSLTSVTVCDPGYVQIQLRAMGETESGIPYAIEVTPDEGEASSTVAFWAGYDPSARSGSIQFIANAETTLNDSGTFDGDIDLLRGFDADSGEYAYAEFGAASIELVGEVMGTPVPDDPVAINNLVADIESDPELQRELENRRSELLDRFIADRNAVRAHLSVECTP